MKNLVQLNTLAECGLCNTRMFVSFTPNGADYLSCPCCCGHDFYHWADSYDPDVFQKYFNDAEENDDSLFAKYGFCENCRIVFDLGCVHSVNGCTEDCYNAHFISKNQYKNEIYDGMPQFDSVDEWYHEFPNIVILKWICLNNGKICKNAVYSKLFHPERYTPCKCNIT
jgi:hypothetical protein